MKPGEPRSLYARAYTQKPDAKPVGSKPRSKTKEKPSPYTLIFDCETTIDATQALRVGFYQVRKNGKLINEGLFYEPSQLTPDELQSVKTYAQKHGLNLGTVEEFRKKAFLKIGFKMRAAIVGFNLPFDISRIALGQGEARGNMRGGFSFPLSPYKSDPHVRVKHLSSTAALMDFAKPGTQDTGRGMRNRDFEVSHHRGAFNDLRTISAALTSRKHSLKSLAAFLGVTTQKHTTDEHGGMISAAYLDYARADVQATWECYDALKGMYAAHNLDKPLHNILSEASIGKAYFNQMGIRPLLACQPDIPREHFGQIMSAYFGGRAEVRIRRVPTQVLYSDFKSMYPTVNALMGLFAFVIADGFTEEETTSETQAVLNAVTLDDLQNPKTWQGLTTLVRLKANDDVLPARTKYAPDKDNLTIGLNRVTSDQGLWYTLADVLASKLLTGKTPVIDKAISYYPGEMQKGLKPINLFGNANYRIDPFTDDMFTRLVDLRDNAKANNDPLQQAIKIIANSTCYGIFVEVNKDSAPKYEPIEVYGPDGLTFGALSKSIEEPGKFFHPLLATLITGAARLMLATAERLAADQGLDWVFCDTDSIAMAKPDAMKRDEFIKRGQRVIDWFEPLNPYQKPGSILDMECENFLPGTDVLEPLYCYAISAKRYALFNIDKDGKPIIRKASAHGLGHLMEPYGEDDPALGVPLPVVPLSQIGVKRWQYDYWFFLLSAALAGKPNQVPLDYHPALQKCALSRYGATSPALLRWLRHYNDGKPYAQQVKPFGFLVAPMARTGAFADPSMDDFIDPTKRGRPPKEHIPKPIAPFERNSDLAVAMAFDRITGEPIKRDQLKTYAEALALFHQSAEDKFENGAPWDIGRTERRHIIVQDVKLIGKEANKVGECGQPDPISGAVAEFKGSGGRKAL